jgi:arylsulfatase A-like enzyme
MLQRMRLHLLSCAALVSSCQSAASAPYALAPFSAAGPARGVVLITVDTLRADMLGCYGNKELLTPHIDRLAASGQLFQTAIAQSTTTTPSHSSLLTSLYLQDHNVYSNFAALGDEPLTLAEIFHGRGFRTFAIVNMRHLNRDIGNLGQGFEVFRESGNGRRAGPTLDALFEWLDGVGEQPFFAWIHLADVHTPYRPPEPYAGLYYDADEGAPEERSMAHVWTQLPKHMSDHPNFQRWLAGITDLRWVYSQYKGAVTYVDDEIGRLVRGLEARGLFDRTALVLTADHGEALGEHDLYFVHSGLYEPTVHIPLITYFPDADRRGVAVREVVESVDVLPTLTEYFGLPLPPRARGRSLWPQVRGELVPTKAALIEHAGHNLVALRTERYKYIRHLRTLRIHPSYPFEAGREELYDLSEDLAETTDLSRRRPEVLESMRKALAERQQGKMEKQLFHLYNPIIRHQEYGN